MSVSRLDTAPLQLGEQRQLFAMRTVLEGTTSEFGLVILNAGLLHNVGPFRLHVHIAERIAKFGIPVIRVDQSGKGESSKRNGLSQTEELMNDYDDACDALRVFGVEKFIVAGLCSGADDAMLVAANRDNVHGLILFDGYAKKSRLSRLRSALRNAYQRIRRLAQWRHLKALQLKQSLEFVPEINIRAWRSDEEMLSVLASTLTKGHGVLAVFTAGQDYYDYHGQLHDNLANVDGLEHLDEFFFADSDHTFSRLFYRRQLIDTVCTWVSRRYTSDKMEKREPKTQE